MRIRDHIAFALRPDLRAPARTIAELHRLLLDAEARVARANVELDDVVPLFPILEVEPADLPPGSYRVRPSVAEAEGDEAPVRGPGVSGCESRRSPRAQAAEEVHAFLNPMRGGVAGSTPGPGPGGPGSSPGPAAFLREGRLTPQYWKFWEDIGRPYDTRVPDEILPDPLMQPQAAQDVARDRGDADKLINAIRGRTTPNATYVGDELAGGRVVGVGPEGVDVHVEPGRILTVPWNFTVGNRNRQP